MEQVGKHYVLMNTERRSGGLSTVRKGIDTRDASPVAVKFIQGPNDELSRKVFDRETRALRKLTHPNIVKFRDAGTDDTGTYFLVLEWVDKSLGDLLEHPPWDGWSDLYEEIGKPLLEGLSYAHLNQFEHRDIKPGNILIGSNGAPLLADFGIAKIRSDEQHSELTVQHFRSGPYAPPELESSTPYVRDVYSMGVLLLQCLSDFKIRDFPDVKRALESVNVPSDIRSVLEACVNPDPTERPANGSQLSSELKKIASKRLANEQQPRNSVWLDLTWTAQQQLAGEPVDRARAETKLKADLAGEVFAYFVLDQQSGKRDRDLITLIGAEHRYTLRADHSRKCYLVTAAPSLDLDVLEGGRRHGLCLPALFSWTARQPLNMAQSEQAASILTQLIEEFYDRKDDSSSGLPVEVGDELFDVWLRILDAREDLARGEHKPLGYKKVTSDGRRSVFVLSEPTEVELVGTDWEVSDQYSGRKFGHGEVIDQDTDQITLLSSRPLVGLPASASLIPYDSPSSISLNRQRNAVLAVQNGTNAGSDLRNVLIDPSSNAKPSEAQIVDWGNELDTTKKRAVQLALGTEEVLAVQGPPGTGKTRFITEVVTQFLKRNPEARVLIASQTHVAVDNAVERLHKAGVTRMVRLAGVDESVVEPAVRNLLLATQTQHWAESVRTRAGANIKTRAKSLGIDASNLRAALTLEQLAAVSRELEEVENHVTDLLAANLDKISDLNTAIEDEDPTERYQARLDQLNDRRKDLIIAAQRDLAGQLTIPSNIDSREAEQAIDLLLSDSAGARELLAQLRLQAEWLEAMGAEDSLTSIFLSGISVVAGTCTGFLRNKAVSQLEFDLCIVDEASKATLTEALVPMSRAKSWILVGDTHQLPPTDEELLRSSALLGEHDLTKENIKETLFQRLVDYLPEHSQVMLDEQYRMVKPLGDLISSCFYDGRLRSPREDLLPGYKEVVGATVTWLDTATMGDSRRESGSTSLANRTEAQVLVAQLESIDKAVEFGLIKVEGRKLEVLVIAPYKRQVEELKRRLAAKAFIHIDASVMSVDAVQGREADLTLLSLTRSNSQGKLGFLGADYWRRINVALSRARYGLTIVGDADFFRGTNSALRSVLDYMEEHPADCVVRTAVNE